jgi:hypothetical protein
MQVIGSNYCLVFLTIGVLLFFPPMNYCTLRKKRPMRTNQHRPLIRLDAIEATVFLIREELKLRKLFRPLARLGVIENSFEIHLDDIILLRLEYDDSDVAFERYNRILDKRSRKVNDSPSSATKQAKRAYHELIKSSYSL